MALSKRHRTPLVVIGLAAVVGAFVLLTQRGTKAEKTTLVEIQKGDLSRIAVEWYPERDTRYDSALEKAKKKAERRAAAESGESLAAESGESSESSAAEAPEDAKRIVMRKVIDGEDQYWELEEPVQCRIDPSTSDGLVGTLAMLKADRLVDFDKGETEDDSSLGLDKPVARVTCEGKRGNTSTLMLGRKHPTTTSERYARVEGDSRIAIVAASLLSDLTREAKDIRDKRLFSMKSDEIKTVEAGRAHPPTSLSGESGESEATESELPPPYGEEEKKEPATDSYSLTKGEDANGDPKWSIAGEITADADSNEVSTLVSSLASKRAEDFVVDKPTDAELAEYGLDSPAQSYTLTGRKKHAESKKEWRSDTTEMLQVGHKTADGKSYYIRVSWRPEIMKIAAEGFEIVSKSASDLRDKAMHQIEQKDLTRIETTRGGFQAKLEYDKKDKKWNLADGSKPKEFAVSGLVSGLANLSISKFISEEASDLAKYGLDQPQATVVLTPKKGDPVTVYLGKAVEGDSSLLYAKRADRDQVVAIDSYRLYSIPEKLSEIADIPTPPQTESSAESVESFAGLTNILN